MKRTALYPIVILLAVPLSAAAAFAARHLEYVATLVDKNGSKVLGAATMVPSEKTSATEIMVQLKGSKPGTTHPWSVRSGKCASPGPVWGDSSAYKPLAPDAKGVAMRKAEIALQLPDSGDFYISIQQSPAKREMVHVCSNFQVEH